ncbi:hypothetical protein KSX_44850 [Ktedonospora formicarum]|uniref:Uncharacterized protein n=1 Tax=Ktedonospora formicarum TaxID=2778364 RepID=A0A8J3HY30_9CHLR|nr:hypothetical protein KSX_44850 [Ktedonospora formicarum]
MSHYLVLLTGVSLFAAVGGLSLQYKLIHTSEVSIIVGYIPDNYARSSYEHHKREGNKEPSHLKS